MSAVESPEVIVIGAGLGGLAAACDLAKAGKRVLLLERHNLPGGFATSFVRGRFEFETSLHEIAATAGVAYLKELLPELEFLEVPEAYRLILTDKNIDFLAPFGMDEFIEALEKNQPDASESIRRFMKACEETFEAFQYLGENPRPSLKKLFGEHGNFLRTGSAVLDEVADAVDLPDSIRDLVYPYWCYIGVPADQISFSLWASMVYTYVRYGAVIPRLRSHGISTSLAAYVTRHGGSVRYNTEVKKLKTRGRLITGVVLADGESIDCDNVISNVSPHRLFGDLAPSGRFLTKALRTMNARQPGISFFVLYLGLDASVEELGFKDYSLFIAPHMNTRDLKAKMSNRHDPDPMQAAVCLNMADPQASPEGTTILSITIGSQPEAWADVKPEDYHREKSRFAEIAITQFEKATGILIRDHIEEMELAAPPTFSRYVGSWDGTVYGYEPVPWDGIIPRVLSKGRERIFKNLHFCGGNAFRSMGYGSSLLSGRGAAEQTQEDMDS